MDVLKSILCASYSIAIILDRCVYNLISGVIMSEKNLSRRVSRARHARPERLGVRTDSAREVSSQIQ